MSTKLKEQANDVAQVLRGFEEIAGPDILREGTPEYEKVFRARLINGAAEAGRAAIERAESLIQLNLEFYH